jgi:hypothetical protein
MKAIVRVTPSTYESGDVISIISDLHATILTFNDIPTGVREVVDIGTPTQDEQRYLLFEDRVFKNISASSQIPAFRHSRFKDRHLKIKRRRKYKLDAQNKPEQKEWLLP